VFWFLTWPLIFCSSDQLTALHLAADIGNLAVCEQLIAGRGCKDQVHIYILNLLLILCCIIHMLATHPPSCSDSDTPLKSAIDENKTNVVALLRSVGASQ
jgi:hypothetical protein